MLSVCLLLFTKHAKRMRRIVSSSVACPSVPYFSTLFHNGNCFREKNLIERKIRVLILSTTFVPNISHSKKNSARYIHKYKLPVILDKFQYNLNFLGRFSKNNLISNFMKISPVLAELLHAHLRADRQTDRHEEINSRLSQFLAKAPKMYAKYWGPGSLFGPSGTDNLHRVSPSPLDATGEDIS